MGIFRNRIRSFQELVNIFTICVFPVHVWLIINILREVPAWVLRLSIWDLIGVIAYSLVYALFESTLVFLGVLFLITIMPMRIVRGKVIVVSAVLVFITSIWAIFLHYNNQIIEMRQIVPFVIWGISYVVALLIVYFLIHRRKKVEDLLNNLLKRLAVLSFVYVLLDVFSIVIISIRNL